MYNVSTQYESDIRYIVRNPSYLKIDFVIADPESSGNASVTSSTTESYYSNKSDVVNNYSVDYSYMTLENNRLVLDGVQVTSPELSDTFLYQGFVGSEMSSTDRVWTSLPKLVFSFTKTFDFIGLTFNFDTICGEFPESILVVAYSGVTEIYNNTHIVNSSKDFMIEQEFLACDKIEITGLKSTIPERRFHLEDILFGLKKTYTDENISEANWKREVDFINSKLPTEEFNFTIYDVDREYDPENASGIYSYIEEQQPITFSFGYELNDGTIEWLQSGDMFTTSELTIESSAVIPTVTFNAISTLSSLTGNYNEGVYSATGVSLYSLLTTLLEHSNLPLDKDGNDRWSISPSLNTIYSKAPIPTGAINSSIQLLANAGMCTVYTNRNGRIIIESLDTTPTGFNFGLEDVTSIPVTKKYPVLQGVDTSFTSLNVDTVISELATFDITDASNTVYELEYDMATGISAVAGSGLSIIGTPEYFAKMCRITLTGTGTLTLNGYAITGKTSAISVEFNLTGERCPISNEMITDRTHAISFGTWVGNYVNRRNLYSFSDRGFPEIDCGDSVTIDTLYSNLVGVSVISSEISFNGAISGTTKVLIEGNIE